MTCTERMFEMAFLLTMPTSGLKQDDGEKGVASVKRREARHFLIKYPSKVKY